MVTLGSDADAVAEHALALMLCVTRELPRYDRRLRQGKRRQSGMRVEGWGMAYLRGQVGAGNTTGGAGVYNRLVMSNG